MTTCDCAAYGYLELDNTSIYKRIQESKHLYSHLARLASSNDEHLLLRCSLCKQFWQSSLAALWANKQYCFKVPDVEPRDWITDTFMPPDEMVEYNKSIRSYKERQTFTETVSGCKYDGCSKPAIKYSVMCLQHHMQKLQDGGTLAARPKGQLFEPYHYQGEEMVYVIKKAV